MKSKTYLCLALLGMLLPWSAFVPFILTNGLDAKLFMQQAWQTPVSRFFVLDVVVSALTVWVFVILEGRALRIRRLWIYIACSLLAGVSLGLPLFLFKRARKLRSDEVSTVTR